MAARIKALTARGFRCLDGLELTFESSTALIGANGAGKSSILRALEFVFGNIALDDDDFTDGSSESDLAVEVIFADLTPVWTERLMPWLDESGDLSLRRLRATTAEGERRERWVARRRQVPSFVPIRQALASGSYVSEIKTLWAQAQEAVADLPDWTKKDVALGVLAEYEREHRASCTAIADDFGLRFGPGGDYDLSAMIELLVLPAMRDATAESAEGRTSALTRLVDITVRAGMGLDERLSELTEEVSQKYAAVLAEASGSKLEELSGQITDQLKSFAPGASVSLTWEPRQPVMLNSPPVRARIVESGHMAEVGRQGHGVQRAYVFSLLRTLLEARRSEDVEQPGLVLAVEEPEAYQHPLRTRYVAKVLRDLGADPDAGTQVIFTTHSPLLVSVEHIAQLRSLRMRADAEGGTSKPRTRATAPDLDDIADRLDAARLSGKRWTRQKVESQLPGLLGTNVSEGLFADAVVLVEGREDEGILTGAAEAMGVDLPEQGIAVIRVDGKPNLPLAMEVFRAAGVPTYVIFDTDSDGDDPDARRLNFMITELACGAGEQIPGTKVARQFAALAPNLRAVLDEQFGQDTVQSQFESRASELGLPPRSEKNQHLARAVVSELLFAEGAPTGTVQEIIRALVSFRAGGAR